MLPRYIIVTYVVFVINSGFVGSSGPGRGDRAVFSSTPRSIGGERDAGSTGAISPPGPVRAESAIGDRRNPGRLSPILVVPSRSLVKKNDNGSVAVSAPSINIFIWIGISIYLYAYLMNNN